MSVKKMRENMGLYRGKRKDNGAWETGGLVIVRGSCSDEQVFISDEMTGYHTPVITETVGQFTGVTDKNGRRIFEGDIVRYGDTIHRVVFEQRNGTAYFGLIYSPIETLPFGHYQDLKQIEVIGNIYDNPELIKEG